MTIFVPLAVLAFTIWLCWQLHVKGSLVSRFIGQSEKRVGRFLRRKQGRWVNKSHGVPIIVSDRMDCGHGWESLAVYNVHGHEWEYCAQCRAESEAEADLGGEGG